MNEDIPGLLYTPLSTIACLSARERTTIVGKISKGYERLGQTEAEALKSAMKLPVRTRQGTLGLDGALIYQVGRSSVSINRISVESYYISSATESKGITIACDLPTAIEAYVDECLQAKKRLESKRPKP